VLRRIAPQPALNVYGPNGLASVASLCIARRKPQQNSSVRGRKVTIQVTVSAH